MNLLLYFLSLSITGSFLALFYLLCRTVLKRNICKTWQYYIWLIILLRFLIPFTVGNGFVSSFFQSAKQEIIFIEKQQEKDGHKPETNFLLSDDPETRQEMNYPVLNQSKSISFWQRGIAIAEVIWFVTAVFLFARKVFSYFFLLRKWKREWTPIEEEEKKREIQVICTKMNRKRNPKLVYHPGLTSPMMVGLFHPTLVLTQKNMTQQQLRFVFLHEIIHDKRKDILYKWFVVLVVCLHWFNPLVYLIRKEMNQDCELSCDEIVMKNISDTEKWQYGDTLLALMKESQKKQDGLAISLNSNTKQLKERLGAIMNYQKMSKKGVIIAVGLVMVLCLGFMSMGAYAAPSANLKSEGQKNIDTATSQGTLQATMQAIKNLDLESLNQYSDNEREIKSAFGMGTIKEYIVFSELARGSKTDLKFNSAVVEKLAWSIGEVKEEGNHAEIKIQITNRDLTELSSKFSEEILNSIINFSYTPKDFTDYVLESQGTITFDITVEINKKKGVWQTHLSDEFINAIYGNMVEGSEMVFEEIEKNAETIGDKLEERTEKMAADLEKKAEDFGKQAEQAAENLEKRMNAWSEKIFGE